MTFIRKLSGQRGGFSGFAISDSLLATAVAFGRGVSPSGFPIVDIGRFSANGLGRPWRFGMTVENTILQWMHNCIVSGENA